MTTNENEHTSHTGLYLPARQATMLKSTSRPEAYPVYFALLHTTERVQRLFESLRAPAQAQLAAVSIRQYGEQEYIGVPFTDLREEARFALDGFYLFGAAGVPTAWVARERLDCVVTPYAEQPAAEGEAADVIRLPMSVSPPWEMCAPSYIGCLEAPARIARLTRSLQEPESYLRLCTLQVLDRAPAYRRFRVAPLSAALPDARVILVGDDPSLFSCFYKKTLADHPLLAPYWKRFEPGVIED